MAMDQPQEVESQKQASLPCEFAPVNPDNQISNDIDFAAAAQPVKMAAR